MAKAGGRARKGQKSCESTPFVLPAVLDIARSEALRSTLLERLGQEHAGIVLLAADVSRITTPCMQVLLAAEKTLLEQGGKLTVTNVSSAMAQAFADIGLADALARWGGKTMEEA